MISHYIAIGFGGALGAMARVALGYILPSQILGIPMQMLCVNILGCLSIGVLTQVFANYWPASMSMKSFLVPGLLGGFTTFSAFALEFGLLYEKGFYLLAFLYAITGVVLSFGAFFAGLKIVKVFL